MMFLVFFSCDNLKYGSIPSLSQGWQWTDQGLDQVCVVNAWRTTVFPKWLAVLGSFTVKVKWKYAAWHFWIHQDESIVGCDILWAIQTWGLLRFVCHRVQGKILPHVLMSITAIYAWIRSDFYWLPPAGTLNIYHVTVPSHVCLILGLTTHNNRIKHKRPPVPWWEN